MSDKKIRVDKWLWAVRIFKSRTKATEACKKGHVKMGESKLKAANLITSGDRINIFKGGYKLEFKVNKIIGKRVSASLAQPCYDNLTPVEELNKFKDWFIGKASPERRIPGTGRPTKKERRELEHYKDEIFLDDWFDD
ncbi:MAG: RNA-binding S4 domain-containing protein [Chitinophagia bacterium]|nr:RNA-binding S4 domain-containing protein [Chitinophagia bacterium]